MGASGLTYILPIVFLFLSRKYRHSYMGRGITALEPDRALPTELREPKLTTGLEPATYEVTDSFTTDLNG